MSGGVGLNELIPMSGEDRKAAASNLAKFHGGCFGGESHQLPSKLRFPFSMPSMGRLVYLPT